MILVDTSVWADHFRSPERDLQSMLRRQLIVMHNYVLGELALGHLRQRRATIASLMALPHATMIPAERFVEDIVALELVGSGLGYVDCHLLTSAKADRLELWTRDRRLAARAAMLDIEVRH